MGKRAIKTTVASLAVIFTLVGGGGGCVERRVKVTSEPSGARVWLNDEVIGVTPCEAGFKFYGKYDVRLALDGYEPIHEGRVMKAPIYEYPIIDLAATAVPFKFKSVNNWHFVFVESRVDDREGMIGRAMELRTE
ncbi:MAG: PEGA domain-containing protein [Phycisphaerales bacterium]|nr:PEGA domain-containing protein [Phycisphaerales bacterium]